MTNDDLFGPEEPANLTSADVDECLRFLKGHIPALKAQKEPTGDSYAYTIRMSELAHMTLNGSDNSEWTVQTFAQGRSWAPFKVRTRKGLVEALKSWSGVSLESGAPLAPLPPHIRAAVTDTLQRDRQVEGAGRQMPDPRRVFVVHGRNLQARDALFTFLGSIGLQPLEFDEALHATGTGTPYVGQVLDVAFSQAQAVVVLLTPDDEARLREPFCQEDDPPHETQLTPQARPNVIFEAGMALGRSPDHTILVQLGTMRSFSDIAGRHVLRLNNTPEKRQDLAQRLQGAGCATTTTGTRWYSAGDFDSAVA